MKLNKKFIAIPAIALAAGLGMAACGSSGSSAPAAPAATSAPASSAPASLTVGSATYGQICQAAVGHSAEGLSVTQVVVAGPGSGNGADKTNDTAEVDSSNPVWRSVSSCTATMSDGSQSAIVVTLSANGSIVVN
jgi:hypothetical protein